MTTIGSITLSRMKYANRKSYSIEYGYTARRRSLIEDAKFDKTVLKDESSLDDSITKIPITEEELNEKDFNLNGQDTESSHRLMISIENQLNSISKIFQIFQENDGLIEHIESRPSKKKSKSLYEVYLEIRCTYKNLIRIINSLKQSKSYPDVIILDSINGDAVKKIENRQEDIWIPFSIWDLDTCTHLNIKYEPDIDSRHPGFSDMEYRKRRQEIADIAFIFKQGDTIPRVMYIEDELKTWNLIYRELSLMYPTYACKQHRDAFKQLEEANIYSPNFIPQLEDVSRFLKKTSGFQLRPVAGLLSARDFLASLAFRVFQCTQYIRHSSTPLHSPEPDCVHELLGHVPLLSNPVFAEFSQELGILSLGASDEDIVKLSTLYWFTVEFGICKEDNELRAYGAGLLSAFGELKHALSGKPELKEFEPDKTVVQEYQDEDYQPVYFVADSFDMAREKLRKYAKKIKRPYEVRYDPYTQSIKIVNDKNVLQEIKRSIDNESDLIVKSFEKLIELKL